MAKHRNAKSNHLFILILLSAVDFSDSKNESVENRIFLGFLMFRR
ncbi:MAG: hypothetical protein WD513_03665 [Balneolaceae bacterium]